VLATLHLPRSFYRKEWFCDLPPTLFFNCVSESQARTFRDLPNLVGVVSNGIAVERFPVSERKADYVLWLGRICEEKAPHLAVVAARRAGAALVLAGQVYPFSYHQQYFARAIKPLLERGSGLRLIGSPCFAQKLELLQNARAVLLTSTVDETSSLVALEAMACGTPVIAFRRGAFSEIVADGVTGYLVDNVDNMAHAIREANQISPQACRTWVEQHLDSRRMARAYEGLYRSLLESAVGNFMALPPAST
jgi:glycosyltransferase involved in cell wall biosynthesis